jgi:uncharacterized protein (TIGR02996 family)
LAKVEIGIGQVTITTEMTEVARKPRRAPVRKEKRAKPTAASHVDLLHAILEDPLNDQARLVYADALQELGDPRGEYIALSFAKGKRAAEQAQALLDTHRKNKWQNFGAKGARYTWERGFVQSVGCKLAELVAAGPLMWEVEPIERLNIYDDPDGNLGALLAFPLRIRSFETPLSSEVDVRAVAAATTLGNVTTLKLRSLAEGGAKHLAASKAMPALRAFTAKSCGLDAAGFKRLLATFLAKVSHLDVAMNELTAASMTALGSAPCAASLESLEVSDNPIGDAGVIALARANLVALKTLRITSDDWNNEDRLGARAAAALVAVANTTFKHLEYLDLSYNLDEELEPRVRKAYGQRLVTE